MCAMWAVWVCLAAAAVIRAEPNGWGGQLVHDMMSEQMSRDEQLQLRDSAKEMFMHAYKAYMDHAYPADELMPLSCTGRWRHLQPSRGDIDEAMGNFSLTLVDSLDSLVLLGELDEFERAVRLVIRDVSFDSDLIVSVFETNIRMLGGLISGHVLADELRTRGRMTWYRGELLRMARELGLRLLPAFNTSTGIPHSRINLRYGMSVDQLQSSRETCTACAGTMLLEFAALSRLLGEPEFETRAHTAMDHIWRQRHRQSDLVGTTINVHSGEWVRRDSGVGAGIDSYYEYCLKAYILLGEERYLMRFNRHYDAVMRYISRGPLLLAVHMHRPETVSRNFMDALLAFWPGLQVLKGDIAPAIQTHAVLYQVMQRYSLLPEAFTMDFKVHWGQHPLRPELAESTYMLYRATGDHYYLRAGRSMLQNLRRLTWTRCGFAAVKDVRTGQQEDRFDSFVLAETFKYLFLLFADESDLAVDLNRYLFSTEGHLLPLSLARSSNRNSSQGSDSDHQSSFTNGDSQSADQSNFARSCPNTQRYLNSAAASLRRPLSSLVTSGGGRRAPGDRLLTAAMFDSGRLEHLHLAAKMGVTVMKLSDGRLQLTHSPAAAESEQMAAEGVLFMQEMQHLSQQLQQNASSSAAAESPRSVSFIASEDGSATVLSAGSAHFGLDLASSSPISGRVALSDPWHACPSAVSASPPLALFSSALSVTGRERVAGRIAVTLRGHCMFVEKARTLQAAGARALVVIDDSPHSSARTMPVFAMSGDDGDTDVKIPVVFLYGEEGALLLTALRNNPSLVVTLSESLSSTDTGVRTGVSGRGHVERVDLTDRKSRLTEAFPIATGAIQQLGSWVSELVGATVAETVTKLGEAIRSERDRIRVMDRSRSQSDSSAPSVTVPPPVPEAVDPVVMDDSGHRESGGGKDVSRSTLDEYTDTGPREQSSSEMSSSDHDGASVLVGESRSGFVPRARASRLDDDWILVEDDVEHTEL